MGAFVKFLDQLPERSGRENSCFTDEQAKSVFATAAGGAKSISAEMFTSLLHERRICVNSTAVSDTCDGAKSVGSVEPGEGIEVLERKESNGTIRIRCKLV